MNIIKNITTTSTNTVSNFLIQKLSIFVFAIIICAAFISNNAMATNCPPDDGQGVWKPFGVGNTIFRIPIDPIGTYHAVPEYTFCFRYNEVTGECEFFISSLIFPMGSYDPELGPNAEADYWLRAKGHLAERLLNDDEFVNLLRTLFPEDTRCFDEEVPPCDEDCGRTIVVIGMPTCIVSYWAYDERLNDIVRHSKPAPQECLEAHGISFVEYCGTKYSYCWFEAIILIYEDGKIVDEKRELVVQVCNTETIRPSVTDCPDCVIPIPRYTMTLIPQYDNEGNFTHYKKHFEPAVNDDGTPIIDYELYPTHFICQ